MRIVNRRPCRPIIWDFWGLWIQEIGLKPLRGERSCSGKQSGSTVYSSLWFLGTSDTILPKRLMLFVHLPWESFRLEEVPSCASPPPFPRPNNLEDVGPSRCYCGGVTWAHDHPRTLLTSGYWLDGTSFLWYPVKHTFYSLGSFIAEFFLL